MKLKKFLATLLMTLLLISSAYASDIYNSEPTFAPYSAGSVKSSVLNEALAELNYIRWLIGVPNNVTLSEEYTRKAQHGAVLLDALNTLTHTPSKPGDMSESFYSLGKDATTHGNIAYSQTYSNGQYSGNMTLSKSTKMYMEDSDEHNISALGHRRWLMNPRLRQTGFGISTRRGFAVTYVIESFSDKETLSYEEYQQYLEWLKWPISDEFITWPTSKHEHPLTYFDANTAWSVTLNSEVFDTCRENVVEVKLTRQSDGKIWHFSQSNSYGYFNINKESVAYDECIIFRPQNITSYNNNETWQVEVTGLTRKDGGTGTINYTVKFSNSSTGYEHEDENFITYHDDGESSGGCNFGFSGLALILLIPCVIKTYKFFGV